MQPRTGVLAAAAPATVCMLLGLTIAMIVVGLTRSFEDLLARSPSAMPSVVEFRRHSFSLFSFLFSLFLPMPKEPLNPEEVLGLRREQLPRHIAIIMDGNGRWASERGVC